MQTYLLCLVVFLLIAAETVLGARNPNRTSSARTGNNRDERALKSFMHRVSLGRALSCQSDADCGKRGGSKCVADNVKLCGRPSVANIFKAADEQTCRIDADCQKLSGANKLAFRCAMGKCDFCGPKVCQEDRDCCASGHGGAQQKCAKLSGYPEKRCWNTCAAKADCTNTFGVVSSKLACVENVCQKRTRKGGAGAAAGGKAGPAAVTAAV